MTISRICQREVELAEADESVQAAAQRMGARSVGTLIVVNAKQEPIGILTDRDLATRVVGQGKDPVRTLVRDVMTPQPKTVTEKTPIEDALARMRALGVRRLPVVGPDKRLIGIISLDDILSMLAEEFRQVGRLLDSTSPRSLAQD